MQEKHIPVLLDEVLKRLNPQGGTFVDGTFGAGGYTRAILKAHPDNKVIAFDRDPTTHETAKKIEKEFAGRFQFIPACFSTVSEHLNEKVDGFVLDIGVSSMQIDTPERGFSLRFDGPLDMRMGNVGMTAADVVNTFDEAKLADILYTYGEEKMSRKIAKALIENRPITTTKQLAEVIHHVMPKPKDKSDSATRSFQALRIFVNDELGELDRALNASKEILKPTGRLVVVSFHSLEDRIVKQFLRDNAETKSHQNKYAPTRQFATKPFKILEKEVVIAGAEELKNNVRAHSAKLRWAVKT